MRLSRFFRGVCVLLVSVLLGSWCFPAAAQVYEQDMPADWQEKDILRITSRFDSGSSSSSSAGLTASARARATRCCCNAAVKA